MEYTIRGKNIDPLTGKDLALEDVIADIPQLIRALIDEYYIYVMPTVLGNGIPLFPAGFPKTNLKLESCKNIGEVVELVYRKKE